MNEAAGTPRYRQWQWGRARAAARAAADDGVPRRAAPVGIVAAASLLGGVGALLSLPSLPGLAVLAMLLPGGLVVWARRGALWWLGPFLVGAALAGLHVAWALSLQLPPGWEGREVRVSGRIVELPDHQARRTSFMLRADAGIEQPDPLRGRLLRLSWYDDFDGGSTGRERLRAGQHWTLDVRIRAPRGLRNAGGFDSEKHALARRLSATGYVRSPDTAKELVPAAGLAAWREAMSDRIAEAVPADSARFIQALALGDTRAIDDADWRVLRANGLTHLVAISGFHVGLVAGFAALLASGIWWLWPGLGRVLPRPSAAALAALAGAGLYAAAAGFALPTVRTVLMIAVVALLRLARRRTGVWDVLALAALAVLLVDPLAVLGAGFWLSFFGVAWLLWCLPEAGRRPFHDLLSAQAVATVGLLPLTVVLFNQASLAGPFANLVAVPWWSLVVVPLALAGSGLDGLVPGAGGWAWSLAAWCFDLSWPLFEWLAMQQLSLVWLPEAPWFALPLAVVGALWLLLPRGLPGRPLALLLWLPLLWPRIELPGDGEAELHVLDVGQGLSVLVRTHSHALLYDTGPAVPEGFDAGERVVAPALRALGVRHLDRMVISHGDSDHAGGMAAVRSGVAVHQALAPEAAALAGFEPCLAGESWEWDGVRFRFLHPPRFFPDLGNEGSCVLRIETVRGAALLPGDIGRTVERGLVRRGREAPDEALQADVVLVPHHGSGGSSDPEFVAATRARFAVVASGHGNRFGHPRQDVVRRWRESGADLLDTADTGAVHVRLDRQGARVETRRRTHPRLWDAVRRAEAAPEAGDAGISYRPD